MEFKALDTSNKLSTVHLSHPGTGELLYTDDDKARPVTITVHSPDSDQARRVQADITRRRQRGGRRKKTLSPEQYREMELEYLIGITHAWTEIEHEGRALECPKDAVLLYDLYAWVVDQVNDNLEDRANFL